MPENNGAPETPSTTSGTNVPERKPKGPEPQNEAPQAEVGQEQQADAVASTADTRKSWWEYVGSAVAPVLVVVISVVTAFYTPTTQANQLTVVAALIPAGDHSELRGRVLRDGDAQDKALVWAIVTEARGHRDSPPATLTDDKGGFDISQVPSKVGSADLVEATVYAKKDFPGRFWPLPSVSLRGEETVPIKETTQRRVELSALKLLPLPAIFLISMMLPFFGKATPGKRVFAILLAFLFTGSMIVYLSLGLRYVNTVGKQGEILSLGFASIYQGSYVKEVPQEWLFSLTASPLTPRTTTDSQSAPSPGSALASGSSIVPASTSGAQTGQPSAASPGQDQTAEAALVRGFGAPLWVLLVSVLGAGTLTVGLIVQEIDKAADQSEQLRASLGAIVQHQFFILFAPLGAVFVYQLLVVGEAAKQPLTVALASLGAGASMNALLSKAVEYSTGLIQGFSSRPQAGK